MKWNLRCLQFLSLMSESDLGKQIGPTSTELWKKKRKSKRLILGLWQLGLWHLRSAFVPHGVTTESLSQRVRLKDLGY